MLDSGSFGLLFEPLVPLLCHIPLANMNVHLLLCKPCQGGTCYLHSLPSITMLLVSNTLRKIRFLLPMI